MPRKPVDIEYDEEGLVLGNDPSAMLALPEGLLALGGLPVTFGGAASYPVTPEKVLEAAEYIIAHRSREDEGRIYHNQAQVMSHASRAYGWLTGEEMELAAIANYMRVPKQDLQTRQQETGALDALIHILRSGYLTTEEGTKALFPDMDMEDVWARHRQRQAEARETQARQMDLIVEKILREKEEKAPSPDSTWVDRTGADTSRLQTELADEPPPAPPSPYRPR